MSWIQVGRGTHGRPIVKGFCQSKDIVRYRLGDEFELTYVVALLGREAHAATHIRVDRKREGLDEKSAVQRGGFKVNLLCGVEDSRLSRLR